MDTLSQSTNGPFKNRNKKDLAPVTQKLQKGKLKKKNRRKKKKKKNRKFGKELQNRGDLVYVRKEEKIKDCSTAETEKSKEAEHKREEMVKKNQNDGDFKQEKPKHLSQGIAEIFVHQGSQKGFEAKKKIISELSPNTKQKLKESIPTRVNPQNVEAYHERITQYLLKKDLSRKISVNYLAHQKTFLKK